MDLWSKDATELLELLAQRKVTSVQLVEALFERTRAVDPKIRGFVHRNEERVFEEAQKSDARRAHAIQGVQGAPGAPGAPGASWGKLEGLPISVKENLATRDAPLTLGMQARVTEICHEDAAIVSSAQAQGAFVLGKSNVPQTLLAVETTNALYGTTSNPWSLTHAVGGSSGGEAALIASGQSPLGFGTDIGGSIRIPAAFCGIAALKPTWNRWSNLGSHSAMPGQEFVRAQSGPLARSSRDLQCVWQALDVHTQRRWDPRVITSATNTPGDLSKIRVGFYTDNGVFRPAASLERVVRQAAEMLRTLGAQVEEVIPLDAEEIAYLFFGAISSDGAATVEALLQGEPIIEPLRNLQRVAHLPTMLRKGIARMLFWMGEKRIAQMLDGFGKKSVERYWRLAARRNELQQRVIAAWQEKKLDVVVCPTFVTPAMPHRASNDFALGACYSMRYNVLDFPAGVVPMGRVRDNELSRSRLEDRLDRKAQTIEQESVGLPLGVQLAALPYEEDKLLFVMHALEQLARTKSDYPITPV